jgi:maleylacetate reductase
MSLHHKLCHVLGGTFGLPHADTHTVVLPHVLAFVLPAAPRAAAALGRAVSVPPDAVPVTLQAVSTELGAPGTLAELGMPADGITEVVRQVLATPYASPRPVTAEAVTRVLRRALAGDRPE